jgi:tRNA pseudouridine55 synthase
MMKNDFHGIALIKKPAGITSHEVVARARRVFGTPSVGHCGTLDPMATGLLILLIGEGTKLSQYILEGDKSYRVGVLFGQETDTLDVTGTITKTSELRPLPALVEDQGLKLQGDFRWPIPKYSAKKIDGKKLYEYAREGQEIESPTKEMRFWDIRCISVHSEGQRALFDISCSKGSFIRTWAEQLGQRLECGATMESLERTASTPYSLSQANTLEEISSAFEADQVPQSLIPLEMALSGSRRLKVKGHDEHLFKNGQISFDLRARLIQVFNPKEDQFVFIIGFESGKPLGVVGIEPGKGFVIRRVFKLPG